MSKESPKRHPTDAEVFAAIGESFMPYELSSQQRESMRARIFTQIHAGPPDGTDTIRFDEGEWKTILPLVEMKVLRRDVANNNQTALYRLRPGAEFPRHRHTQEEECLVLSGEINIGDHYVREGDLHIAKPGADHPPVTTKTGALLLIRAEIFEVAPSAG